MITDEEDQILDQALDALNAIELRAMELDEAGDPDGDYAYLFAKLAKETQENIMKICSLEKKVTKEKAVRAGA